MNDDRYILGAVFVLVVNYILLGMVLLVGAWLMQSVKFIRCFSLPARMALAHTVLLAVCIALYPTGIFVAPEPYDDIYLAYLLIPGVLILLVGGHIAEAAWPWLQHVMSYHEGSIVCIVFIPGAVGLVLGAMQWYLIGWLIVRLKLFGKMRPRSEPRSQP